jgi:hypothetical protein
LVFLVEIGEIGEIVEIMSIKCATPKTEHARGEQTMTSHYGKLGHRAASHVTDV